MVPQLKAYLIIAVFLSLASGALICGQKTDSLSRWIVDRDDKVGAISSKTTEGALVRMYGRKNVTHGTLDIGEGETMPATILFADIPLQRLEIAWKDEPARTLPARIQIQGEKSLWKTSQGITLGITLKSLEKLNGGSFTLAGFGWDYSGTVTSWNKGRLEGDMKNVVVRLGPAVSSETPSADEESVEGDAEFPSSHSSMQKVNPKVYQLIWLFE